MKKLIKIITIILAFTIIFTIPTACNKKEEKTTPYTILRDFIKENANSSGYGRYHYQTNNSNIEFESNTNEKSIYLKYEIKIYTSSIDKISIKINKDTKNEYAWKGSYAFIPNNSTSYKYYYYEGTLKAEEFTKNTEKINPLTFEGDQTLFGSPAKEEVLKEITENLKEILNKLQYIIVSENLNFTLADLGFINYNWEKIWMK